MSDRLRELELRGRDCRLEVAPLGYRTEAERSNGAEPLCCWNSIAAARACSRIRASSYLLLLVDDDRTLDHRVLPELVPPWLGRRFSGPAFLLTGSGKRHAHRLPIETWVACREDGRNGAYSLLQLWSREERESRELFRERKEKVAEKVVAEVPLTSEGRDASGREKGRG